MSDLWFQCRLKDAESDLYTVAWIEERGAKVGNRVQFINPADGWWDVIEVHGKGMEYAVLMEKQALSRNSLPSIPRRYGDSE